MPSTSPRLSSLQTRKKSMVALFQSATSGGGAALHYSYVKRKNHCPLALTFRLLIEMTPSQWDGIAKINKRGTVIF